MLMTFTQKSQKQPEADCDGWMDGVVEGAFYKRRRQTQESFSFVLNKCDVTLQFIYKAQKSGWLLRKEWRVDKTASGGC